VSDGKIDGKIKVLVLAADPTDLGRLQLGKEVREIVHNIREAQYAERFEVVSELAVRRSEFIKLLTLHNPTIVHFSGHGSIQGPIFLVSEDDKRLPVSANALREIFAEFKDTVRLVVLNACYTKDEAEAIVESIDCAVGTAGEISDAGAIAFSGSFYNTLASGGSIDHAFKLGMAQLLTEELEQGAQFELLAKQGTNSHRASLVPEEGLPSAPDSTAAVEIETDPTGRVYLSHVPSRKSETQLIASALRDRGIPLYEESLSEDMQLTDDMIAEVLRSPGTASGLLSLTPEAVDARVLNSVELPAMLERAGPGKGFFIAAAVFSDFNLGKTGSYLESHGVPLLKVKEDKVTPTEARKIAKRVLDQRIAAINKSLVPGEPLRLELYTRVRPPSTPGAALSMDWTERFKPRYASAADWDEHLLPALRDVVHAIEEYARGRVVQAEGRLSLPAAIALGCSFVHTKGIKVRWAQHTLGRDQLWSLDAPGKTSNLKIESTARQPNGADIAVLVSVTNNVEPDFEACLSSLPPFRAVVRAWTRKFGIDVLANRGQAADAAAKVGEAIKAATNTYRPGRIHLFMAVPAGLAMMIAQFLNTIVPVQTYDLDATDKGRQYRKAALLRPND
jgi:SMODS-associated and fused to various effectors sensor domain/CHAT domain